MKKFRALLAVSAATLAISGVSMAAELEDALGVTGLNNGGPNVTTLTASGTLSKYIVFTTADTEIDMDDFGGPGYGSPTAPLTYDSPTSASAEIVFDSNTHLDLMIVNGGNFTNVDNIGAGPAPQVNAAELEDTLPTKFRTEVKGVDVLTGFGEFVSSSTYEPTPSELLAPGAAGLTGSGEPQFISYGHGPQSGVRLGAQVERKGHNDHFGEYKTSLELTWFDLD